MTAVVDLDVLAGRWADSWPQALAAWGSTTRLHAPVLHTRPCHEPSFAWFDIDDVEIHIDLTEVVRFGVQDHAVAVLAHEIGHHLLAPADRLTAVRMAARVRVGLVDRDDLVGLVANVWSDLLINDRLQRQAGVDRAALTKAVGAPPPDSTLGLLMMRTYEILWALPRGDLTGAGVAGEAEAQLCARHVRAYARDPVGGAAGFAVLVRSLLGDAPAEQERSVLTIVCGGDHGSDSAVPSGAASDPTLGAPAVHPALDPKVTGGLGLVSEPQPDGDPEQSVSVGQSGSLTPAELHAVLSSIGRATSLEDVAIAWYREHASPYLVPFPTREQPVAADELMGGLAPWELGDDLGEIDWTGSVSASPVLIPGVTTVRREMLEDEAAPAERRAIDLDLYLDSSGSMPDPRRTAAPIALAGAVLALSALRAGARVQATTWSAAGQVIGTDGFTRDATAVLRAVVAYIGGGTDFPLGLLARTHLGSDGTPPTATGPTHIAVISDDGISTMFRRGWGAEARLDDTAERALATAAGGSLVLQVPAAAARSLEQLVGDYDIYPVTTDDDLVQFARDFSRRTWGLTHAR